MWWERVKCVVVGVEGLRKSDVGGGGVSEGWWWWWRLRREWWWWWME